MENRKVHSHSSEGPCPAGISIDHCFGIKFSAVSIRGSQDDNDIVFAVVIDCFFDIRLTLRVKRTRSGSDETLGQYQYGLCPCTSYTGFDGRSLDAVPFTNDDHLFPFQFHF